MSSLHTLELIRPAAASDLEPLREAWNALAERHRSPTQRVEWAQASLATLWQPHEPKPHLYTVRRGGRLTALAFLRVRRDRGTPYLEDMGTAELDEPADLLYESSEDLRLLLAGILRAGWPLVLCRLPDESQVPQVMAECLRGRGLVRVARLKNYPYVPLAQFPEGELNSGRKSDLRRMRRRAAQQGEVRVSVACPAAHEVLPQLDLAILIEAASWKSDTGFALQQNVVGQRFLRDYLPRAAQAGILRMAFMHLGERPVAMQIATHCGGGYWLLKIGYDATLGAVAPGQLLMQDTLKHSVDAGLQTYELMGTAAEWTRMWTSHELQSRRLEAFPVGWRSARLLAGRAIAKAWSRTVARRRMPATAAEPA